MKSDFHYIAVICFAGFLAGCLDAPDLVPAADEPFDAATVAAGVEAATQAFLRADTTMNAEAVIDLLWPEFTMLVDGSRTTYDEVAAGSREFMASLELFHTEWTDVRITPLGPDAAVASFHFRDSIVTKTGELIQAQGPTTFVWQQRNGAWRLLYADADHYPVKDSP